MGAWGQQMRPTMAATSGLAAVRLLTFGTILQQRSATLSTMFGWTVDNGQLTMDSDLS